MSLAPRLTERSATMDDVGAITELAAACELADDGVVEVDPDDIRSDLRHPDLDLARDTTLVFDGDRLAAWSLVLKPKNVWADVHPEHRGRGIGTAILAWSEERARETGFPKVGQTVTDANASAAELFVRNGYEPESVAWILSMDTTGEQPEPVIPDGIEVRGYRTGTDEQAAYLMIQDAFDEWPDHERAAFDVWRTWIIDREVFAPEHSFLAFDVDELVGAVLSFDYGPDQEGWTQQVATKASHRHRGIGRGLLQHAFRSFHDVGRDRVGLSTNSYTGALGMYERVGMTVRRSYTRYAKSL